MKKHLILKLFLVCLILPSCKKDSDNDESGRNQNANYENNPSGSYIMYNEDSTSDAIYSGKSTNKGYIIYNKNTTDTAYTVVKENDLYYMYEKSTGLVRYTIKKSGDVCTIYKEDSLNELYKSQSTASLCWLYTMDKPSITYLITYYNGLYRVYHKEVDCSELLYTIKHNSKDYGFSDNDYIAVIVLALGVDVKSHSEEENCYCNESF